MKVKQDYSSKLVEYDCYGALDHKTQDFRECRQKAIEDLSKILEHSDSQTFLFVKNAYLLGSWRDVPRRMKDQVHFDNDQPGAWFGGLIFTLSVLVLLSKAVPLWSEAGFISALVSTTTLLLAFLVPLVALKGVEDKIVEAQYHQTELGFSSQVMALARHLDYLERQVSDHKEGLALKSPDQRDAEQAIVENSDFVTTMMIKIDQTIDDIDQISILAPNEAASERASRLCQRAQELKTTVEDL